MAEEWPGAGRPFARPFFGHFRTVPCQSLSHWEGLGPLQDRRNTATLKRGQKYIKTTKKIYDFRYFWCIFALFACGAFSYSLGGQAFRDFRRPFFCQFQFRAHFQSVSLARGVATLGALFATALASYRIENPRNPGNRNTNRQRIGAVCFLHIFLPFFPYLFWISGFFYSVAGRRNRKAWWKCWPRKKGIRTPPPPNRDTSPPFPPSSERPPPPGLIASVFFGVFSLICSHVWPI